MLSIFSKRYVYIIGSLYKYPLVAIAFQVTVLLIAFEHFKWVGYTFGVLYCGLHSLNKKLLKNKFVLLFCIFITVFSLFIQEKQNSAPMEKYLFHSYQIEGRITQYPTKSGINQVIIVRPAILTDTKTKETFRIADGLIRMTIASVVNVEKDDNINVTAFLDEPSDDINGFNYKEYLKIQDIYAISSRYNDFTVESSSINAFQKTILQIRKGSVETIQKQLPEPHAGLLTGMLFGSREKFPEEFATALQRTGTTHIIAVSGFNITVIVSALLTLVAVFPRKLLLLFIIFILVSFITLVGFDNLPAFRAVIMGISSCIGMLLGRKSVAISLLALAFSIMMISNPLIYHSLSFELSFGATLGLMFLSAPIESFFKKILNLRINSELSSTLSAIIATFPISFTRFRSFSLIALLVNVLVAPLISPIMLFGFLFILCGRIHPILSQILEFLTWIYLEIMIVFINFFSKFEFSYIEADKNLTWIGILVLIIIMVSVVEFNYQGRKHYAENH